MNADKPLRHPLQMKEKREKIACLTVYDAAFARILESEGIDLLLVGDSLGMVLHGDQDTLQVSMEDMIYHTRIVSRAIKRTPLIADMPYRSYTEPGQALINARRLLQEGGADMVKLEGGGEILEVVTALAESGIAVCGHLGLQPQSVHEYGGYKVQGRRQEDAVRIYNDALMLQDAGVKMIVLECIPSNLAGRITEAISIPTIGIGAGTACDGQVLVLYDVLGISAYIPKMARDFLAESGSIRGAVRNYIRSVKSGTFPSDEQTFR